MVVMIDGAAAGILGIADPIKDRRADAVRNLQHQGLRVIMLTGDTNDTQRPWPRKLGIADFEAGVSPTTRPRS